MKLMTSMQLELISLKNKLINNNKLEKELKSYQEKNILLEKEIEKLSQNILEIYKKYNNEKRKMENEYNEEIKNLKSQCEKYKSKIEMVNELAREKNGLLKAFDKVLQERNNILIEYDKMMREKEVNNQIKVSNIKKKMIDSVNETQSKINELNIQFFDTSSKLTILENNKMKLKLEYQTQSINKLTTKNEDLKKKIYELKKDIQIHKEVEISLAEKNKKLVFENNKLKKIKRKENDNFEKTTHLTSYNSSINLGIHSYEKKNSQYNKILQLEKKVLNLEKNVQKKQKEYNEIKDKYDSIEKILKNYEEKYSGLFNFFEDCLKMLIDDSEIKKNKNIFINLNSLKKGDFTKLNNEEKYSTLIILMKYLMPLIHNTERINNINYLDNVNLKFSSLNNENNIKTSSKISNNLLKRIMKNKLNKNELNLNSPKHLKFNSCDGLPNIEKKIPLLKRALLSPK